MHVHVAPNNKMQKMFHLRQLQFLLIIISCLLLNVTITTTTTKLINTTNATAKKVKSNTSYNVATLGAPTVVSSIVIPGKYHAYAQHMQQSVKKLHVSAMASHPSKQQQHHQQQQQQQQQQKYEQQNQQLKQQQKQQSNQQQQQQRQQRVDIVKADDASPPPLPSSKFAPIRNWFGIFNRNNVVAVAHDTAPTKCNCRCGERIDESRIVGGQTAGQYPWMARLSYFNRFYCGGTLINDRYVLTAAHCVKGFMWFMIKVTFGEHDRCNNKERPETRFVLRAFSQKFSFSNFDNDIALLRLNDRVPLTSLIRPICLPRAFERNNLFVGIKGLATGWGTLNEDGKPSCVLQEVEVPVLDNDRCVAQTNYTQKMITKNMMCAGYPGVGERDSCQGDSGGPLVRMRPDDKRFEQIGIVSWGNGCARPDYPGVYTRLTKYLDWIMANSKDGCFCNEND